MRSLAKLVVIASLVCYALSACPGAPECSNHGTCSNNVCSCNTGYTGMDCSIALTELQSSVWVDGSVAAWQWQYYVIINPTQGNNLVVETVPLNGTSNLLSDCDIYVKKDETPTATDYLKANVDWGTRATLLVDNIEVGRYFIGIYSNFLNCSFSVRATLTACRQICVHGNCARDIFSGNSTCVCDNGWSGPTCELQNTQSNWALNTQYTNIIVNQNKWSYYFTDISAQDKLSTMILVFNTTSLPVQDHDCDVYIRNDSEPNFIFWDYRDITISANFEISIPSPKAGRWYIGFWGYKSCTFDVKIIGITGGCPGNCSSHGTCVGSNCSCLPEFEGSNCESKIAPLLPSQVVTGFVSQNNWNYFTFVPNPSLSTLIQLKQQILDGGKTGDCDLYVKRGSRPSRFDFDALDISLSQSINLTVYGDSQGKTLHIGILGWLDCSYSIQAAFSSACAGGCVHGICSVDGICMCSMGWSGVKCDQVLKQLTSGVSQTSQIAQAGNWDYYMYRSTGKDYLVISMKEFGARPQDGFLYLYVREGSQPDYLIYDYIDLDINKGFHTIAIINVTRQSDWYIGVFGSPFVNAPLSYGIAAWETPI